MPRKGVDRFVVERDREAVVHLEPGVFPAGRQAEWSAQNRTVTFAGHPLGGGVAVAVAGKAAREQLGREVRVYEPDQRVYVWRAGAAAAAGERLAFVGDTHAVFAALQSIMEAEGVEVGIDSMLRMSALYREAMLRQVRLLQGAALQTEFVAAEIDTFQAMHAVWHLFEVVYLATNAPGLSTPAAPCFVEWLNFNFPAPPAEDGRRLLDGAPDADALAQRPGLWPYARRLALRGHTQALASVLERAAPAARLSAAAARWARELAQAGRDMPRGSGAETAGSFNARWRQWNAGLQSAAAAIRSLAVADSTGGDAAALEALCAIADIMRGDADAVAAEAETWAEMLGAILLYSEPTAQADRLPGLALVVLEQFQTTDFTLLDRALVALLSHDLPEFLVYCGQIDPWLPAHLADAMDHIGILDICRRVLSVDPRDHYLIALGEAYVAHEDTWRAGLDYLGLCRTPAGRSVLTECAVRIPLDSDRKAQQVLRACDKYGLGEARAQIHRQLGRQKWRRGRLGAAIGHYAQAADDQAIGAICDQLWAEYLESGTLAYGPVIDGVLAAGPHHHDRLRFLTRYRDFYECYRAGDHAAAAQILLSILVDETAPPHAVADLLVDSIPLLEGDDIVFTSDDTLALMRCAESLVQSPFPTTAAATASHGELSVFNVACARNLARAFATS
ncbi:hypothetical protein H4R18_001122 [Coemansia javaensis]|uniref:Nuclear pore complex protein Nup85 n=1 Tax=Coemansia javaensis TaxID=2761396 RepID=A0A9W8HEN7_9FUNG|nr:hypothetical protein H4R18_001122 [Coemansia javaensis]